MNAFIHNHKLKLIFFLLFGWTVITAYIFFGNDIGISTIADNSPRFREVQHSENIQRFEIKSEYDNLGVIVFKFRPPKQIPSSNVSFQIREKDSKKPIADTQYSYHDLYTVNPFPIGFPVISYSAGNTYYIDFINRENGSSLVFEEKQPITEIRYVYSKEYLLSQSTNNKLTFIVSKLTSLITSNSYRQFTFQYVGFALIVIYMSSKLHNTATQQLQNLFGLLTIFTFLGIAFTDYSDLIYLAELVLLSILVRKWRLTQEVLIQNAFLFFIISTILLLSNQKVLSEIVSIQFILIIIIVLLSYILHDKINFKYNNQ